MRRFPLGSLRAVWLGALLLGLTPKPAFAFCQTHTCEFPSADVVCVVDPVTGCSSGGAVAHWKSGCVSYAVQDQGSAAQRITASELQSIVQTGFGIWSGVSCGGAQTPALTATFRGQTACDQVEYNCGAGDANANIVMFRDHQSDLPSTTIALSTVMANLKTGEILDVDIELNSERFNFYLDDASARPDAHDLRLVLNHELGHMLGLSHTLAAGALMRAAYDGIGRFPAQDDINGICQALSVADKDPSCSVQPVTDGGACVGLASACPGTIRPTSAGTTETDAGCSLVLLSSRRSSVGWAVASGLGLCFTVLGRRGRRARRPLDRCSEEARPRG